MDGGVSQVADPDVEPDMTADRHPRSGVIRRAAARLIRLSASPRLLCLLRGHVPDRLRTFVHGRTITTCTRCGLRIRRGRNMQWDTAP